MAKWPMVRLGDVCTINMGQSPSSESYNDENDGIPFYQGNADFGEIHPKARLYCNKPIKIANKNDVLLSVRAPIGALNIANEKCCIGRGLCAITEKENISYYKYIYYVLKRKTTELIAKGTGSTFKAINKSSLLSVQIPLPPINIQKYIADILDKTQEIIDSYKKQLAELDILIKAVFYEMFGDPVINEKNWNQRKLSVLSSLKSGGTPSREFPEYFMGDIPWITTVALDKLFIGNEDAVEYITEDAVENSATKKIPPGSILFGVRVGVGKVAINLVEMCTNQDIIAITNIDKRLNNVFLMETLKKYSKFYSAQQRGATIKGITSKTLQDTLIPIPPLDLQTKFATIVTKIEEQKALVKQAIAESEHLFNSLMSEYFD